MQSQYRDLHYGASRGKNVQIVDSLSFGGCVKRVALM